MPQILIVRIDPLSDARPKVEAIVGMFTYTDVVRDLRSHKFEYVQCQNITHKIDQ
jgi:hypothetical protein